MVNNGDDNFQDIFAAIGDRSEHVLSDLPIIDTNTVDQLLRFLPPASPIGGIDGELSELYGADSARISKAIWDSFRSECAATLESIVHDGNGVYFSDVFIPHGNVTINAACDYFRREAEKFTRSYFIGTSHGDHIHIIHDCPYSDKSCRCAFKKKANSFGIFRRTLRSKSLNSSFTREDWNRITEYFLRPEYGTEVIKIGNRSWGIPIQTTSMEDSGHRGSRQTELVEACLAPGGEYLQSSHEDLQDDRHSVRSGTDVAKRRSESRSLKWIK